MSLQAIEHVCALRIRGRRCHAECSCGWRSLGLDAKEARAAKERHLKDSKPKPHEVKQPGDTFRLWNPYLCPECESESLFEFYYADEEGRHQHTGYICTFWPAGGEKCGWQGWTVPEKETEK